VGRIQVLICQTQDDILSSAIAEAVRASADLELVGKGVMAAGQATELLRSAQAPIVDVLVLVGDSATLDVSELLARQPSLRILQIHIRRQSVRLELQGLGLAQLIATLRVLAEREGSAVLDRHLLYEIEPGAQPPTLPAVANPVRYDDDLWFRCESWIDAVLLLYQLTRPSGHGGLAGLALPTTAVEDALVVQEADDVPGLAAARVSVERAAAALQEALRAADPLRAPLAALARNLALSDLEFEAVLLGLAPEIDCKYQRVFGVLNDDLGRRTPTLGLVCSLLGSGLRVRRALVESGRLAGWRLLDRDGRRPAFFDDPMRIDAHVVAWLLGDTEALAADAPLRMLIRHEPWPGAGWLRRLVDTAQGERLSKLLAAADGDHDFVVLSGDDHEGWRAILEAAAQQAGRRLIRIELAAVPDAPGPEAEEAAVRLARAVALTGAVPVLDAVQHDGTGVSASKLVPLAAAVREHRQACVVIAPHIDLVAGALGRAHCVVLQRNASGATARGTVIREAAAHAGLNISQEGAQQLASTFHLGLDAIDRGLRVAAALGGRAKSEEDVIKALARAWRRVGSPELPRFGRLLEPAFRLDDVVLPPDRKGQLREIVGQVVNAAKVLEAWGFDAQLPYGRGVAALFAGASGTGKTMAAQAIARELRTDLFAVDLSRVVSKYIGETEKNLDAVFDDAQRAGAVLLFDEADALFGKRSEVKDAHDRYANIEVAYLLQRMEAFTGLAILTTNFQQNLDPAFSRRLRFVIEFPRPDAPAREAIWRKCLPSAAPVADDADFAFLANCCELNGGNIRQVTLRAAFAAAQQGSPRIEMQHLVDATAAELRKLGMDSAERQLVAHRAALHQLVKRAA
jgi:hypothetical protein